MTDFGPFARWPDPRAYELIAGYRWGEFQEALLLGQRSWDWCEMSRGEQKAYEAVVRCLSERGFKIDRAVEGDRVVATITIDGIPPDDVMLSTLLDQWGLRWERMCVLSIEGPVDMVDQVPIFRACVFGKVEDPDGEKRPGLHPEVWIVGRPDVITRVHIPRLRGTLRRARNSARRLAQLIPDWERAVAEDARRERERAEAVLAIVGLEVEEEDEGVIGFMA